MIGFVIFLVGKNQYAINIEMIQRIIQAQEVTVIPNSHPYIDGMISYEEKVLKVIDFRKMSHIPAYEEEVESLFEVLKVQHHNWMDRLRNSVEDRAVPFTQETDPRRCELGIWLASFNSSDNKVNAVLRDLNSYHNALHRSALTVLNMCDAAEEKCINFFSTDIKELFNKTMYHLDELGQEIETVAESMQKFLVVHGEQAFIIKVDSIVDIAYVDESAINKADSVSTTEDYLCIDGILDNKGTLVNVIKSIELPESKEQ